MLRQKDLQRRSDVFYIEPAQSVSVETTKKEELCTVSSLVKSKRHKKCYGQYQGATLKELRIKVEDHSHVVPNIAI